MSAIGGWWQRVRNFVLRDRATRELEEEMRLHRELRAQRLHESGADVDAAREAASRRFGNSVQFAEASRDAWGWSSFDELRQDIRYAARRLRQRPGFTLAVTSVLALGIGATSAMFSAVDAAMIRPLPFERPDELVTLPYINVPFDPGPGQPEDREVSFDIQNITAMPETFAAVSVYASGGLNLAEADRPMRVKAGVVAANFFATLGVTPEHGRLFGSDDVARGAGGTVILSWHLWQRQFGGSEMIGKSIPLNNKQYQVIGIMRRGFTFPLESDLWIPMSIPTTPATFEPFRGFLASTTIARVVTGVHVDNAQARLRSKWDQFIAQLPRDLEGITRHEHAYQEIRANGALRPLRTELVGDRRRALLVLFGATVLLLLIACANVTNLLLSYGAGRRRELAVRAVLGATRGRVVRQLLAESVLLSVSGAAVGIAVAPVILRVLRAVMPGALAGVAPAQIDVRVLAFAAVLGIATGIAFGLWPAFGATRVAPADMVKSGGGHGASAAGTRRTQRALVAAELALTVMLLVGAGLMFRSFRTLIKTDSGLNAERVSTLELSFARGVPFAARLQRVDAILDKLRAIPGVSAAGATNDLPLARNGGIAISVKPDGVTGGPAIDDQFARYLLASEDYFKAMGIRLVRGRPFAITDDRKAPRVALISEYMAKRLWPNVDAVGRTFHWGGDSLPIQVIGVVADVREAGLDRDPGPQMYFPVRTQLGGNIAVVVRSPMPPSTLLRHLSDAVRDVDRTQAVYNVRTMESVVSSSVAGQRANTLLISLFGILALVVSALGVYAVTSYAVAQRGRELGIRAALGATRRDLVSHIGGEMTWVALIGVGAGSGLAWALARVMDKLLYGVTTHDAATFAAAPAVLVLAALVATVVPARRAMRVDPADVMRTD